MTCYESAFQIGFWMAHVALKAHDFPLLHFFVDGRAQVAQAVGALLCTGGLAA